MVKDLPAGPGEVVKPGNLVSMGGVLFFFAGVFETNVTLWKSNGLPALCRS
jgi:hypothetical protein